MRVFKRLPHCSKDETTHNTRAINRMATVAQHNSSFSSHCAVGQSFAIMRFMLMQEWRIWVEEQEEGIGCAPTGVMTLAVTAVFGLVIVVVGVILVTVVVSGLAA